MPNQDYQARGPANRTALITVRVAPEHRELLHQLADERGETLSRMLMSPWLATEKKSAKPAHRRAAKPVVHEEATAVVARTFEKQNKERSVANDVSVARPVETCAEVPSAASPVVKRVRAGRVLPGQESLLFECGGDA